ncbi:MULTISPECIES: response regulator transcription factor [Peptoniphilus]|uniref:response regulator transcription factor n=1 Tax=Peptoniphilus TaxID=162289 RepID=UPI0001DCA273|nr:response regulator transcription factor [Peptoniphilus sp. oral taxon 836]EFK39248.1 response regulator receiver domain protein [Peptoniphilus sp. oral taxon 836 str. F0141]
MRILIVEDEKDLCQMIAKSLKESGYEVDIANNGNEAMELLDVENYDLIVLDLNLPEIDGMEILEEFRTFNQDTKIIILSARSQIKDKVEGLDKGANDYLSKPFHLDELEARIRSLTRRNFITNNQMLSYKNLSFDSKKRIVKIDDKEISLTRKELGILEYLLLNRGRPISQEELIDHVWDSSVDLFSNSIRVHISALRKKLKKALKYDPIINRVGLGYQLEEE